MTDCKVTFLWRKTSFTQAVEWFNGKTITIGNMSPYIAKLNNIHVSPDMPDDFDGILFKDGSVCITAPDMDWYDSSGPNPLTPQFGGEPTND